MWCDKEIKNNNNPEKFYAMEKQKERVGLKEKPQKKKRSGSLEKWWKEIKVRKGEVWSLVLISASYWWWKGSVKAKQWSEGGFLWGRRGDVLDLQKPPIESDYRQCPNIYDKGFFNLNVNFFFLPIYGPVTLHLG